MEEQIIQLECVKTTRAWRVQISTPYDANVPYGINLANYNFEVFTEELLVDKTTREVIKREVNSQPLVIPCPSLEMAKPGLLQDLLQTLGYFIYQSQQPVEPSESEV